MRNSGLLFALAAVTATAQPVSFTRSFVVPDGGFASPTALAAADFNNDGKLDLAAANTDSDTVTVRLGNGDGSFRPPTSYDVVRNPTSLAVGDFTGDGRPDVVVACIGVEADEPGGALLLVNRGDGRFDPWVALTAVPKPNAVVAADFNKDGRMDLAFTSGTAGVAVLLAEGSLSFMRPAVYNVPGSWLLLAEDFDQDGVVDLAMGGAQVSWLKGNRDGTFAEPRRLSDHLAGYLVAGDFNGDGFVDLAGSGTVWNGSIARWDGFVLISDGGGGFETRRSGWLWPKAAADFDRDGRLDVIALELVIVDPISPWYLFVSIYPGMADGSFGRPSWRSDLIGSNLGEATLAVADWNNDGAPDLLTASELLTFHAGTGEWRFGPPVRTGGRFLKAVTADFNGDGLADVAAGTFDQTSLVHGDAMMTETATGKVDGFPLLSANFNAEGRADLVTALPNEYLVEAFVVWQGTGGTMEAIDKITVDYAYPAVAAGDLDGDRRADLVVGFQDLDSRPSIQVFLSRSGRLMPGGFYRGGRSPRSIVIADFNQDGWKDIATANMDAVTVLINKGDGTFRDPWFFAAGTDPWSLVTGDFNRDGKLDLAAGHESGILILLGVGNGEFSRPRDIPLKERPLALAAGDFNADGVDDLAISRHQGGVRVLPGFNDGWFREVWDAGVQGVVQSLSVADLNRDGRADLIVAGNGGVSGWLSR